MCFVLLFLLCWTEPYDLWYAVIQFTYGLFFLKVANPIEDGPKRVPVSQCSAQSRVLNSGMQAQRVPCSSNFAQRVPVQSQKPVLSNQKLSHNQTTQQPRPRLLAQTTATTQAPSNNNEKPPAPVPGNSEDYLHVFMQQWHLRCFCSMKQRAVQKTWRWCWWCGNSPVEKC